MWQEAVNREMCRTTSGLLIRWSVLAKMIASGMKVLTLRAFTPGTFRLDFDVNWTSEAKIIFEYYGKSNQHHHPNYGIREGIGVPHGYILIASHCYL